MKAITYHKYGSPDVLELREIEKPEPRDNEVLVKVNASSVNDWDWGLLRGQPFVNRIFFGLFKPRIHILGADVAGCVEAVGRNIKSFKPGDEVFGDISGSGWGGFAEYVCVRENALMLKPGGITFAEAAASPQAGLLALQSFGGTGKIRPGQRVLINGAGGGAGTFAIQIAKSFGAEVTGVDATHKLETMRLAGADEVIDYTREDFTRNGQAYDFILDVAAHHPLLDYKRALRAEGTYIMVGGSATQIVQGIFLGPIVSMTGNKKMRILAYKQNKQLAFLKELLETRKVVPVIDKRFNLEEVPEALRYFGEQQAKGKIVITIEGTHYNERPSSAKTETRRGIDLS